MTARIDCRLDLVGIWQSRHGDLNVTLTGAGDADLSNAKNSLQKRLIKINGSHITMPNLGDALGEDALAKRGSPIGDFQVSAFAVEPPEKHDDQANTH